jgi:signal transduction histidine kinase
MRPELASGAAQPTLSSITHELRTPLNSIKTWAHVLETQLGAHDDPVVRQALKGILSGIDQQARLIDRLADGK